MRIVFDAYWWDSGPPSLRHVVRELVLSWVEQFPEDEVHLLVRRRARLDGMPKGVSTHVTRWWPQAFAIVLAGARLSRRLRADVIVAHNFGVPRQLLGRRRALSVVYLQDVLFVTNPEWFTPLERAYFRGMTVLARTTDVVFTSTRNERSRILGSTAAKRVEAVGLGLSSELQSVTPDPAIAERLGLTAFMLSVGRLNARKNLENAILGAAASGLLSSERPLVVVGEGDGRAPELPSGIARMQERGTVRFAGRVSERELRWLYANCELFLCTSLDEGFGMPPVEALALGARVVASDIPVFHETLGDLATFVDPLQASSIGDGIRAALASPVARDEGEILRRHSWASTARSMRDVVERARRGSAG